MKVLRERISFVSDAARGELALFLEGFRVTLSGEEARLLAEVVARGLKELYPDAPDGREPEIATLLRNDSGWRDKVTLDALSGERDGLSDRRCAASVRSGQSR